MTTTVANRAIKARPKATPERLQEDVINAHAIVDETVVDNAMRHIAETEQLSLDTLANGDISVPMAFYLKHKASLADRQGVVAVQIAADQSAADLADELNDLEVIVLPMVSQTDGRSYSIAYQLRTRYNYRGEIRAIGYVRQDQLMFLRRAGCNAFELHTGDDYQAALKAFSEFSEVYQPSADDGQLIFARRRRVH